MIVFIKIKVDESKNLEAVDNCSHRMMIAGDKISTYEFLQRFEPTYDAQSKLCLKASSEIYDKTTSGEWLEGYFDLGWWHAYSSHFAVTY